MGGTYYAVQGGSRILSATRADQSGADDANVVDWVKTDDFILAVNIHSAGKDTVGAQYKLRWRALPAGTFVDMDSTGVINYTADTSLVNGDPIAVGGRKCSTQGDTWQAGEEVEGAVNCDNIDLAADYETEIHFALDCSGAADNTEYEFELYDDTLEASRLTCGATIRIKALPYDVTEIDSLEHDVLYNAYNSFVMIDATHFILAYTTSGFLGYIKTFSIDGSYDNITEIDSLEHDGDKSIHNSLVMIDSTHFILAYAGLGDDGYIKTFSIDGNYDNITEIDSLEHDAVIGYGNSLVKIDATHFMLAYLGSDIDGYVKTFSIDGNYDNITEIDILHHDTDRGASNSLVMIDSTHFILAYAGLDYDGYIKTFSIDGNYDNITEIDSLEHDTVNSDYNSLVKIDSTHFILAYTGTPVDGYVKTFSIDGSYDNITEIHSIEHDTDRGTHNSFVLIDSTHFMLAYTGLDGDGYIKVFSIDGSHNITEESSLEHDTDGGIYNSLVMIDSTHFILAYAGLDGDGYIKTFEMEESGVATRELVATISITTLTSTSDINILRPLTSTIATTTATNAIELLVGTLRELIATISTTTATSTSDINILREIAATSATATSTNAINVLMLRELISTIPITTASTANLNILRPVAATIATTTLTSTTSLSILRELLATITTTTLTSSPELTRIIALATTVATGTLTSSAALNVLREIDAIIATTTLTSAPTAAILRELTASIDTATSLNAIELLIGTLRELVATIATTTLTSTADLNVVRALITTIATQTGSVAVLDVLRELSASIDTTTSLSNIELITAILRELSATIATTTSTSVVSANILRELTSSINTTTATSAIELLIAALRELTAVIATTTSTSDSQLNVLRELDATMSTQTTSSATMDVLRELITSIDTSTELSDIQLLITGLIELVATIATTTATSTPEMNVVRELTATIPTTTSLSSASMNILREFSSTISTETSTSDVSLAILRALTAQIATGTDVSDASVLVMRELSTTIPATTLTSAIELIITIAGNPHWYYEMLRRRN